MNALDYILFTIIGIMVLILFAYICSLIISIIGYFDARTKREELLTEREKVKPILQPINYLDKIDSTVSLLNLINILIDNEITKMLDSLNRLKVKYDSKSLDKDAKNIAENVYTSLKKDSTFSNENIILTDEYIMKHISEESITRLMIRSYTYNSNGVVSFDKPKK